MYAFAPQMRTRPQAGAGGDHSRADRWGHVRIAAQSEHVPYFYRPVHTGLRFPINASMPSPASCAIMFRAITSAA